MVAIAKGRGRFLGSPLSFFRMHWDHEPRQRVGCGVLTAPRPGGLGTARPTLRFMGSFHDLTIAHWGHEPLRLTEARSGPRVSDPQPTRFMGSEHLHRLDVSWGHEPGRRLQSGT